MSYFYPPFWILLISIVALAGVVVRFQKLYFIDIQIIMMIAALGLAADMILCKEIGVYFFVSVEHRGWYSLWACLLMNPPLGYMYVKLLPKGKKLLPAYIGLWAAGLTLFELFIAKPYKIVVYPKWEILPYSPILYILTFTWVYLYYRWLQKNIPSQETRP